MSSQGTLLQRFSSLRNVVALLSALLLLPLFARPSAPILSLLVGPLAPGVCDVATIPRCSGCRGVTNHQLGDLWPITTAALLCSRLLLTALSWTPSPVFGEMTRPLRLRDDC